MPRTIGQFGYTVTTLEKESVGIPFNPFVVIDLARYGSTSRDGSPTISANLMTPAEIDSHIQALKADLDLVGEQAKRALKAAQEHTLAIVSALN